MLTTRFHDRRDAGERLAEALRAYARRADVTVLGRPRGGVPVAFEVATALEAPLDVLVVRKLGVPGHDELAMGAVASGGVRVLNQEVIDGFGIPASAIERVTANERAELARREAAYRGTAPPLEVAGRTVIIVDDGLATGSTMAAGVAALRTHKPRSIVVAAPVASEEAVALIKRAADECVTVLVPEPFYGVGLWYEDFTQTTDEEVRRLLDASRRPLAQAAPA